MSADREYSPELNPHKGNRGILRAWYALRNSWADLVFAVREESAFRRELTLAGCATPQFAHSFRYAETAVPPT